MEAVTYTAFRRELKRHMRACRDDATAVLVTNNDPSENVVVMSQRDYDSIAETMRIYENPYLHDKLLRSIEQARAGGAVARELLDD